MLAVLEGLAQHRLLDRLIRGRTWIGLVAFALIGIVTLQLGLLKLNGGIGRTLEHEALLQRENAALSIENSELSAGSRIEARASQLGMAFVPLGSLRFLAASPHGDAAKAATALSSAASPASAEAPEVARGSSESQSSAQPSAIAESSAESSTESSTESSASASSGEASSEAESSSGGSEESSGASSESTASARSAPAPSESAAGTAPEAGPAGGIQAGAGGE
jgi:cell division protein FtsL